MDRFSYCIIKLFNKLLSKNILMFINSGKQCAFLFKEGTLHYIILLCKGVIKVKNNFHKIFGLTLTVLMLFCVAAFSSSAVDTDVAFVDGNGYATLKAAVEAAGDGDIITIASDCTFDNKDVFAKTSGMYPYISVTDKKLTIDLNGKTVTVNPSLDANMLAVFHTGANGELILTDSSADMSGAVNVTMADGTQAYSMFTALGSSKMTIEGGNYYIDKVEYGQSMLYAGQDNQLTVNGGNFVLGDAHTRVVSNGQLQPWIANASGDGTKAIIINGGTYNVDPTHYHGETRFPRCYKPAESDDGTWSIVYAPYVAIGDTTYEYLTEAFEAAVDGDVITILESHSIANDEAKLNETYGWYNFFEVNGKNITLDLNGKKISAKLEFDKNFLAMFYVAPDGRLTVIDSSEDMSGKVDMKAGKSYIYSMFMADGKTSKLTIEGGNFCLDRVDAYSLVYAGAKKTTTVKGGNFVLGNANKKMEGKVSFPWIFNAYGDGVNYITVTGGTYNVSPVHHHGETLIPATGYDVYEVDGVWNVEFNPFKVQPESVVAGAGVEIEFTVVAEGEGLKYRWYICDEGKTKFSASSISDETYSIVMNSVRDGRQLYCKITDKYGSSVVTDTVSMKAPEIMIINEAELQDVYTTKKGDTVNITVEAEGDNLTYQWYIKNRGSKSFSKSSITDSSYSVVMNAARSGRTVFCRITDSLGNVKDTKYMVLNIEA